ncbi:MAG TPA: helix-hairpin-helix domain-containing protein [Nitrospiraceae bacterium]|nr:helix-hairpin-helix domain-containing protein [Nitrospiraceae bacterium]
MLRSVLIKLAMLGATLSMIVWMGWTAPPNRGEAGPAGSIASPDHADTVAATPAPHEGGPRPSASMITPLPPAPAVPSSPRSSPGKAHLDINQATVQDFEQLPGIGPALAQRIMDHRRSHGPFARVDDLLLVRGIGPKKLDRVREFVTVDHGISSKKRRGRL